MFKTVVIMSIKKHTLIWSSINLTTLNQSAAVTIVGSISNNYDKYPKAKQPVLKEDTSL